MASRPNIAASGVALRTWRSWVSKEQSQIYQSLTWYRKTQVALAHAYWLRNIAPETSIFWIQSSSAERIRQSFSTIAESCKIPGHEDPQEDVVLLVQTWLQKASRPWLIVLDNADDLELFFGSEAGDNAIHKGPRIGRLLPEHEHGKVLITTRDLQAGTKLAREGKTIRVGRMERDDGIELLHKRVGGSKTTVNELATLSFELGGLPLALAQASAYIKERSCSLQDYLEATNPAPEHPSERAPVIHEHA